MKYNIPKYQHGSNLFRTNKVQYVDSVLNANKNKEWVQRLITKQSKSTSIVDPYNSKYRSTHLMSDDGNGYVYPLINMVNDTLKFTGNKNNEDVGYNYAKQNNLGIQLPKEQGTWFANNGYKLGSNVNNDINPKNGMPFHNPNFKLPKQQQGGWLPTPLQGSQFDITSKLKSPITFNKDYTIKTPEYNNSQLIDDTIPLIQKFEKFKSKVYKDGHGKLTIGYGETRPEYINKKVISEPEAMSASKDYMQKNVLPALQNKPYFQALNPTKKIALTDLIYNVGQTKFNNSVKLQEALKRKDWLSAAKEMNHGMNDVKNPGLKTRRLFEQDLFLK